MKVKKYESFDQLKRDESKTLDSRSAVKKHAEFEKLIKAIMLSKSQETHSNSIKQ